MLSEKQTSEQEKKKLREVFENAMPHSPISMSTGVVRGARYINENYVVFDLIIPISLGMDIVFDAKNFDKFEFFYTQEQGIWVKISDIKPFILENLFKQKFFTVGYQIVFVREGNSFVPRPLAFSIDVPTIVYEEWFLQQVVSFPPESVFSTVKNGEALLREMLKPKLVTVKRKRKKKDMSKLIRFKPKESTEEGGEKE